MPSSSDLDQLEGLDWSWVILEMKKCDDCGKFFGTRGEAESHKACAKKWSVVRSDGSKMLKCKCCGNEWKSISELKQHLNSQYDERTGQCNHCLLKFVTKGNLYIHMQSVHYSQTCPVKSCHERFKSPARLKEHGIKAHGHAFSECGSCGKFLTKIKHNCRNRLATTDSHTSES